MTKNLEQANISLNRFHRCRPDGLVVTENGTPTRVNMLNLFFRTPSPLADLINGSNRF